MAAARVPPGSPVPGGPPEELGSLRSTTPGGNVRAAVGMRRCSREGRGFAGREGEMPAGSHDTLQRCRRFVSAINPSAAAGHRARETRPGMQNGEGAQGISQAGGSRRFFCVCVTQECHSSLYEGRFLIQMDHQSV